MTAVRQKITNKIGQSSREKAQKTQAGGPTIAGVQGVGKQKMVTRPNSARRPSVVHGHTTGPSPTGIGEETLDEGLRLTATHTHGDRTAKVYRDVEWEEHRVKHFVNGVHQKEADYHTPDADDAHATAKHWIGKTNEDVAMSVGSGAAVPTITNPTVNYALQKKMHDKLARRKKPV